MPRLPTTVITANGAIDTNEEATVYVKDLDILVTVQLFEDTPAVLSLGKPCEENGSSYEWKEGQTRFIYFLIIASRYFASAITSSLSSFLVDQVKHTL